LRHALQQTCVQGPQGEHMQADYGDKNEKGAAIHDKGQTKEAASRRRPAL
jgi:hypothetical protein